MKISKNNAGHITGGVAEIDEGRRIFDIYIGIDPDISANGYAEYIKHNRRLIECTNYSFFRLYDHLKTEQLLRKQKSFPEYIVPSVIVHLEGGWLVRKSNFHTDEKKGYHTIKESRKAQVIARRVGNNHAIGLLIVEMCIHLDISFVVRQPITPRFADQKYFKLVTGWQHSTNADARSAANYVYGY